jgi:hypothetical protein
MAHRKDEIVQLKGRVTFNAFGAVGGTLGHPAVSESYTADVQKRLQNTWDNLGTRETKTRAVRGEWEPVVLFVLRNDGLVGLIRLTTSTGNATIDQSAINTIRQSAYPAHEFEPLHCSARFKISVMSEPSKSALVGKQPHPNNDISGAALSLPSLSDDKET